MTMICEWCKCEVETSHGNVRYCSKRCAGMAKRKLNQEKREARAKELGITVDELIRRSKRGRVGLRDSQPKHYKYTKRPKTYKEIQAHNAVHPLKLGWRR